MTTNIPGYAYGDPGLATSPVTLDDLAKLEQTVLWTEDDARAMVRAGEILTPRVERVLDVWYGYVGSHPFLIETFSGADGTPDADYLGAVRARFERWIVDLCTRNRDQDWLDYQHEIGLRHTPAKKNLTDGIASTSSEIPLRYLVAFIIPLTLTIRPFLAEEITDANELDTVYHAWMKAVTITASLWAEPYSQSW
jgi:Protoglobin